MEAYVRRVMRWDYNISTGTVNKKIRGSRNVCEPWRGRETIKVAPDEVPYKIYENDGAVVL